MNLLRWFRWQRAVALRAEQCDLEFTRLRLRLQPSFEKAA